MPHQSSLFPVYLLLGPETGKKGSFVKHIQSQCAEAYNGSTELHRFYPFETEQCEAMEVLRNSSLFADHRLVIISQVEELNQVMVQALSDYCAHPNDDATLVLISSENKISAKLQQTVGKEQTIMFWELFENQKKEWLEEYFSSRSMHITEEGIALFLDLVDNNTQEMRSTAEQFASYLISRSESGTGRIAITEADVESFVYHSKKENVFTLFDKIAQCDLRGTLEIFHTLQLAGEIQSAPFFAGLLWQFRRLLHYQEMLTQRWQSDEAMAKTAVLGVPARIIGKRNQGIYRQAAKNYQAADVRNIIVLIQKNESLIREIRGDVHPLILELMLYAIVVNKGKGTLSGQYCYGLIGENYPGAPMMQPSAALQ